MKVLSLALLGWLLCVTMVMAQNATPDITESNPAEAKQLELGFIQGVRQLTFEGRRAGEGYFGAGGQRMISTTVPLSASRSSLISPST